MHRFEISGPPEELGLFWAQYIARPVAFGFVNTFFPAPPYVTAANGRPDLWREEHWSGSDDMVKIVAGDDDRRIAVENKIYSFTRPPDKLKAYQRIAQLFPTLMFTTSHDDTPLMAAVPLPLLVNPLPPLPPLNYAPEIFEVRWHRCRFCQRSLREHANGECLFGSTNFEPALTTWRTVYGDFVWQTGSSSFVLTASSTTTVITTNQSREAATLSEAT